MNTSDNWSPVGLPMISQNDTDIQQQQSSHNHSALDTSTCIISNTIDWCTGGFDFFVFGVMVGILAVLGIFGNILSTIVLSRPDMKSSMSCLLLGLAFCDTLLISMSLINFSMRPLVELVHNTILWKYDDIRTPFWVPYLVPVYTSAQTGSVYLTLAVTIERYIVVCHSLKARSICTWRRAQISVASVLIFAAIFNLPLWFEYLTIPLCEPVNNETIYTITISALGGDPLFIQIYHNWTYLAVMYLIPFSGLVLFNLAIYRQIRQANKVRQQLSKMQNREIGLAKMLLCVVVVFLICNTLPLVNNILAAFYSKYVLSLWGTSEFLIALNSSVNFLIYCACGKKFRKVLIQLVCGFVKCRGEARRNSQEEEPSTQYTE